jgi:hypothetical protein
VWVKLCAYRNLLNAPDWQSRQAVPAEADRGQFRAPGGAVTGRICA